MPGVFGTFSLTSNIDVKGVTSHMIQTMRNDNSWKVDLFHDDQRSFAMGRMSLNILNSVKQPVCDKDRRYYLIFHGELNRENSAQSDAEFVLEAYRGRGDACVPDLNGIFHFIIYDQHAGNLKLFSDKFGLLPLYYSCFSDGIAFSAQVKALCQDPRLEKLPDYRSLADFLHYGQVLGNKTLFQHVKLLAPGSVLSIDLKSCTFDLNTYWHLKDLFVEGGRYVSQTSTKDAVDQLHRAIKVRCRNKDLLGISLSGGLDSRSILAAMGKDAEGIYSYTLGLPGCADQKLAERMAGVTGTRHTFIPLEKSYLQNFNNMAARMIVLSDGMYHPHESTEMLALDYFKHANFKILLRGHGGEIAKAALAYPVMVRPQVHQIKTSDEILSYILNITNLVIRDIPHDALFSPFFKDIMAASPSNSLKSSIGEVSHWLAPADVCIYYYINEHIRRQVVASLEIFRNLIEIRLPYIDENFLKYLLLLPVNERNRGEIHRRLIQKCKPELIKIPDSNTGAPLDAGPAKLFLKDKFNSLMKKLSVRGFRHYTEFQNWHRKGFKESSQQIIFNDKTESRGLYNMDYLKSVFNLHISGEKDYAHLLGTIVGIELWYRQFVDNNL